MLSFTLDYLGSEHRQGQGYLSAVARIRTDGCLADTNKMMGKT